MDEHRIDTLTRAAAGRSRRHLLGAAAPGLLALVGSRPPAATAAVACHKPGRWCRTNGDCYRGGACGNVCPGGTTCKNGACL